MRRTVLKYLHVVFDEDDSREGTFIFVEGKRYVGKCCLKRMYFCYRCNVVIAGTI